MKLRFFVFFLLFFSPCVTSWAAGHGCAIHLPDRDGDGTPDKDDLFPDDPMQSGKENDVVDLHKVPGCPEGVPQLVMYMTPFAAPGAATAATIVQNSTTAIAICNSPKISDEAKSLVGIGGGPGAALAPGTASAQEPALLAAGTGTGTPPVPAEEESAASNENTDAAAPCSEAPASADPEEIDPNAIRVKMEIPESKTVVLIDRFGRGIRETPQGRESFLLTCAQRGKLEQLAENALAGPAAAPPPLIQPASS